MAVLFFDKLENVLLDELRWAEVILDGLKIDISHSLVPNLSNRAWAVFIASFKLIGLSFMSSQL